MLYRLSVIAVAVISLGLPVAASTFSFGVTITPTSFGARWMGEYNSLPEGDPLISLYSAGGCFPSSVGYYICESSSFLWGHPGSMDLNGLRSSGLELGGDFLARSGVVTFSETTITCDGDLAALMLACGESPIQRWDAAEDGAYPMGLYNRKPGQKLVLYGASEGGFWTDFYDGIESDQLLSSTSGSTGGWYGYNGSIAGLSFDPNDLSWMEMSVSACFLASPSTSRVCPVAAATNEPSPVPLPATLPLLAGAFAAFGAVARRSRRRI